MSILDNLEAYIELDIKDKCHYCQNKAKYTDVAQIDKDRFDIVGICQCHLALEASS